MSLPAKRLPYILTGYGLPYTLGYIPLKNGSANPSPLALLDLVGRAENLGLSGIEAPLSNRIPSFDGRIVERDASKQDLGETLRDRKMKVVADAGILLDEDPQQIETSMRMARATGATVYRVMLSNLLCGDRRPIEGGWPSHLEATAQRLRQILPIAEDLDIVIAAENHQDATVDDLLTLYDSVNGSPAFGVTFDTGNPLAVGEDPVESARRLAPIIRHLHLKDYTMHPAPNGYRLVRCVAGQGVIDFPRILEIVHANGQDVLPGIEIAAQATRSIPLRDPDWWSTYPNQPNLDTLLSWQMLREKGRPVDEPYSSPWEQGADAETVLLDEWSLLKKSVDYFRQLEIAPPV